MPPCASERCARQSRWWHFGAVRGATLDGQWLCSQDCVETVVRGRVDGAAPAPEVRTRPVVRLGTLLRHKGVVPADQLAAALDAQAGSGLRLGEQLRAMGAVDAQALVRMLAEQAGVSYLTTVDLTRVHEAPGDLSLDAIHALRLVPIGAPDKDRIRVACPAPVPRTALAVFRQQTGWTPEPFLVSDDDWLALLEHYGAGIRSRAASTMAMTFARESDPHEAARRLAQVVMAAGSAEMHDARWGQYVWVRLRGAGAGFDLLLDGAPVAPRMEGVHQWQAATTSR